jgi:hypothetical protein
VPLVRTRLLLLLAVIAALLLGALPASADEAGPTPVTAAPAAVPPGIRGADLSWPNCPKGMGVPGRRSQGLPLPWASAQFWIIGLTNGRAFTRNPCLPAQIAAARARGVQAAAYTMLSYPNAAERRAHGWSGPFGTATYADRIANVGYAQASYALDTMAAAGLAAPLVWIDVEPRRERRWSRTVANNQALITGALRAAADRGVGSGIYTYARAWRQITGGMQLDVPLWAPGHSRARTFAGKRAETLASCARASFTGGPLVLAQWVWLNRDHNVTCPAIGSVTAPLWVDLDPTGATA